MGSGVTPPLSPPEALRQFRVPRFELKPKTLNAKLETIELNTGSAITRSRIDKYGQAARPISTS